MESVFEDVWFELGAINAKIMPKKRKFLWQVSVDLGNSRDPYVVFPEWQLSSINGLQQIKANGILQKVYKKANKKERNLL